MNCRVARRPRRCLVAGAFFAGVAACTACTADAPNPETGALPASSVELDLRGEAIVFRHDGREERGALAVLDDRPIPLRVLGASRACSITVSPSGEVVEVGAGAVATLSLSSTQEAIAVGGPNCPHQGRLAIDYKDQAAFCEWLELSRGDSAGIPSSGPFTPVRRGEKRYDALCSECHTLDGTALAGPTMRDLFYSEVTLTNNRRHLVDEELLRWVLLEPREICDERFSCGRHPRYAGLLRDGDIEGLAAFLATQSTMRNPLPPASEWPPR